MCPNRISLDQYRALLAAGTPVRARRRASPEEDLHRACVELAVLMTARYPILKWLVHVPNGGKRPKGEAGKLKALGTKPGVPDLMLPRRHGRWAGLAVELKSATGQLSENQREWLEALAEDGYKTAVCRTLEEFDEVLGEFLSAKRAT